VAPEFDIVMVPELLMVPLLSKVPVEVMIMVPVALFVRVSPLLTVSSPLMVTVFVESLVREPPMLVSVNGIFSVTVIPPSMIISSEPVGSTPLLQLFRSDQSPVAPPSQTPFGLQTSTGWFPVIVPVVTPVQSLFIVPMALSMVPDMLLMEPELLMVPGLDEFELLMPLPPVF